MMSPRLAALLPLIVLITSAVVLSLAPILVRLTETGPAAAGLWRFIFALPLLLLLTHRPGGEGVGRPSRWMALAGLFFFLDLSFWHYGIVMTSVANATVLCNLTPVVVTLFAWLVLKQRPRPVFVLALAFAMTGAFAMAAGADGGQGTDPLLGDLLSLSVALWYAGYFLAVKAARSTAGAVRVMLWSTAIPIPLMLAACLVLGESIIPATLAGWAACVGLGVMHVAGQGGVGLGPGPGLGGHDRRGHPDPAGGGRRPRLADLRRDHDRHPDGRRRPGAVRRAAGAMERAGTPAGGP